MTRDYQFQPHHYVNQCAIDQIVFSSMESISCSVMSDSLQSHGILQARILEWVSIPFSKGIFLTQGLNLDLLHYRQILHHLSHQGSPYCSWLNFILNLPRWC